MLYCSITVQTICIMGDRRRLDMLLIGLGDLYAICDFYS